MADYGDASPLIIKELTGERRIFQMTGRGLPYRPISLRGTQRAELTWLPGSPEATATILGATEDPTALQGMWKDKYCKAIVAAQGVQPPLELNGAALKDVREAVELVDDIRKQGQLLEVLWLHIVRRGYLTSFEQRWDNKHDVGWSMDFSWINRGEETEPATFITYQGFDDIASRMSELLAWADTLEVPEGFGLDFGFLDSLQQFQQQLEDLIMGIEDQIAQFTNSVTSVIGTTRGIISTFESIVIEAELMVDFVDSQFSSAVAERSGPHDGERVGIFGTGESWSDGLPEGQKLVGEEFKSSLKAWANGVKALAVECRVQAVTQIGGDILAVVTAMGGQDLRDLSQIWYGTPYEWKRIMIFNDKNTIELVAGETIFIPKMNPAQADQVNPGG
jgi:hypothetical protein